MHSWRLALLGLVAMMSIGARASSVEGPFTEDSLTNPKWNTTIKYCTWCHGRTGAEAYSSAPRIAGQSALYISDQLEKFKSHERIDSFAEFMWNATRNQDPAVFPIVAAYFSKQTMAPRESFDSAMAAKGEEIFKNGIPSRGVMACVLCHGENAHGAGPFPRLASQDKAYITRRFGEWREGKDPYAVPMPAFAQVLMQSEIDSLAEFFASK